MQFYRKRSQSARDADFNIISPRKSQSRHSESGLVIDELEEVERETKRVQNDKWEMKIGMENSRNNQEKTTKNESETRKNEISAQSFSPKIILYKPRRTPPPEMKEKEVSQSNYS